MGLAAALGVALFLNACEPNIVYLDPGEGAGLASLSGRVTAEGNPLAGRTVIAEAGDADITTLTQADGTYSFDQLLVGVTWTVRVQSLPEAVDSVAFAPDSLRVALTGANSTSNNFPGTIKSESRVQGTVTADGNALPGVNVALGGAATAQATTDASGNYAFDALRSGTYTVTISGFRADSVRFDSTAVSRTVQYLQTGTGTFPGETRPLILNTSLASARKGVPYVDTLGAIGGGGNYTWSISAGEFPDGMTLTTNGAGLGLLGGVPNTEAEFHFDVQVATPDDAQSVGFTIVVGPPPITITEPASFRCGRVGAFCADTFQASGSSPPYAWSVSTGTLPAGLALSSGGVLSGTPTVVDTAGVTLRVATSIDTVFHDLTVAVGPAILAILNDSLKTARLTVPYADTLRATPGVGSVAWSLLAGALPQGLTLNGAGIFGGTPVAQETDTFTVRAATAQDTVDQQFTLAVIPSPLDITTTSLRTGNVGTPYADTLKATGSGGTYAWSVTGGVLPAGLSLEGSSGAISGTPAGPDSADVTFQAATPWDTASVALNLTVHPAGFVVLGDSVQDTFGAGGEADTFTLVLTAGDTVDFAAFPTDTTVYNSVGLVLEDSTGTDLAYEFSRDQGPVQAGFITRWVVPTTGTYRVIAFPYGGTYPMPYTLRTRPGGPVVMSEPGNGDADLLGPLGGAAPLDTIWIWNGGTGTATWQVTSANPLYSASPFSGTLPSGDPAYFAAGAAAGSGDAPSELDDAVPGGGAPGLGAGAGVQIFREAGLAPPGAAPIAVGFDPAGLAEGRFLDPDAIKLAVQGESWSGIFSIDMDTRLYDPAIEIVADGQPGRATGISLLPDGDLVYAAGGDLLKVDPGTGAVATYYADLSSDPVNGLMGLDVGPDGSVWVADLVTDQVLRVHGDLSVTAYPIGPDTNPYDVTVLPDGQVYVVAVAGGLFHIALDGTVTNVIADFGAHLAVYYHPVEERVYFTSGTEVHWYHPASAATGVLATYGATVYDLAFAQSGNFFVLFPNGIWKWDQAINELDQHYVPENHTSFFFRDGEIFGVTQGCCDTTLDEALVYRLPVAGEAPPVPPPSSLALGDTLIGSLGVPGEADTFDIDLTTPDTVDFAVFPAAGAPLGSPDLMILGPAGDTLTFGANRIQGDGGVGEAVMELPIVTTGTHKIVVFGAAGTGSYVLRTRPAGPAVVSDPASFIDLSQVAGGGAVSDTVWIYNLGRNAVPWEGTSEHPWLTMSPSSGTLPATAPAAVAPSSSRPQQAETLQEDGLTLDPFARPEDGRLDDTGSSSGPLAVTSDPWLAPPGSTPVLVSADFSGFGPERTYYFDALKFRLPSDGFAGEEWVSVDIWSHDPAIASVAGALPYRVNDIARHPDGDVVVSMGGGLERVDPSTGARTVLAAGVSASTYALHGLDVADDGNVYVADYDSGEIKRVLPDGTVQVVAALGTVPLDVTVLPNGTLYAVEQGSGLWRIDTGGATTNVVPSGCCAFAVLFSPIDGKVYWALGSELHWYQPGTGATGMVADLGDAIYDIDVGWSGNFYIRHFTNVAVYDANGAFIQSWVTPEGGYGVELMPANQLLGTTYGCMTYCGDYGEVFTIAVADTPPEIDLVMGDTLVSVLSAPGEEDWWYVGLPQGEAVDIAVFPTNGSTLSSVDLTVYANGVQEAFGSCRELGSACGDLLPAWTVTGSPPYEVKVTACCSYVGEYVVKIRPAGDIVKAEPANFLGLSHPEGGGLATDTVWLYNTGPDAVAWSSTILDGRASVTPSSGNLPAGAPAMLEAVGSPRAQPSVGDPLAADAQGAGGPLGEPVGPQLVTFSDPALAPAGSVPVLLSFDVSGEPTGNQYVDDIVEFTSTDPWGAGHRLDVDLWVHEASITILTEGLPYLVGDVARHPDGDVIVAVGGDLERVDPVTGSRTTFASGVSGSASGILGLAVGPDGVAYATDFNSGEIKRVENGAVSTLAVLPAPYDVTVLGDGTVYALDRTSGLWRFDPGGGSANVADLGDAHRAVAYNPLDGEIYFGSGTELHRYDPGTGFTSLVADLGGGFFYDLDFSANGDVYVRRFATIEVYDASGALLASYAPPAGGYGLELLDGELVGTTRGCLTFCDGVGQVFKLPVADQPATLDGLLHAWAFDEEGSAGITLTDYVGGADGTLANVGQEFGIATGGFVSLQGGTRSDADYIALPDGIVSNLRDATIELWATQLGPRQWSRIFDFGASTSEYLMMSWTQGTDINTDRAEWDDGGVGGTLDNAMQPYLLGQQTHIVMTIDDDGGAGGNTLVSLYKDGAFTGSFETTNNLTDLANVNNWLGRSQWPDETAFAAYNELRIYSRVLSGAEITDGAANPPPTDPCVMARTIDFGETVPGYFGDRSCIGGSWYYDWWDLELTEETEVQIDLTSTDVDAWIDFNGPVGFISDNNGGGGTNARISRALPAGYYSIGASTNNTFETGNYTLSLSPADPCAVLRFVSLGGSGSSELKTTSCPVVHPGPVPNAGTHYEHRWGFSLAATTNVQIDLVSTDFDAYLFLEDDVGGYITEDDDGGPLPLDSQILTSLPAGNYVIRVTTYGASEIGAYDLSVATAAGAPVPVAPAEPDPNKPPLEWIPSGVTFPTPTPPRGTGR